MAFHNAYRIGLLEKASKIAIKRGVVYSARQGCFLGDDSKIAKAEADLKEWRDRETSSALREARNV